MSETKTERIIITFAEDGTPNNASLKSWGGKPVAFTGDGIIEEFPTVIKDAIDATLTARINELETQLADAQGQPAPTGGVTKLTIMRRLGDKWPTLKAIIDSMPEEVQDAWMFAQEIRADDPLFAANSDYLKTALALSDEEFAALLTP